MRYFVFDILIFSIIDTIIMSLEGVRIGINISQKEDLLTTEESQHKDENIDLTVGS